ncbi:MAG: hypothetical protein J7L11_05800 [Thermoprotei archaeon]|nr:hypothetical protein [Thermoprotei archaeon]
MPGDFSGLELWKTLSKAYGGVPLLDDARQRVMEALSKLRVLDQGRGKLRAPPLYYLCMGEVIVKAVNNAEEILEEIGSGKVRAKYFPLILAGKVLASIKALEIEEHVLSSDEIEELSAEVLCVLCEKLSALALKVKES